jgi:hypothetical protein
MIKAIGNVLPAAALAACATLFSGAAAASATTFMCGSAACSAFGTQPITAIDDLAVRGDYFDVTFSDATPVTTFAFSTSAAAPGQPLTAADAANALDAFYATQMGPEPSADGPGIFALVNGVPTVVDNLITGDEAGPIRGTFNVIETEPFLGFPIASQPPLKTVTETTNPCFAGACTQWTPVAAPTAAPEFSLSSLPVALTLLLGSLVVLRARFPSPHDRRAGRS